MTQDLVELGQRCLLFRLGDGIGRDDLILHERAQIYLSQQWNPGTGRRVRGALLRRNAAELASRTRMQVGRRGYEPVVRTSMAKGMAKLGSRAWTRASRARDASLSAVSTNRMVCWSRKLEIICRHGNEGLGRYCRLTSGKHSIDAPGTLKGDFPHSALPRTFPPCPHCSPTSPGRADAQTAASCGWQTGQSQFSCKGGNPNDQLVGVRQSSGLNITANGNLSKDTYLSMSVFLGSLE